MSLSAADLHAVKRRAYRAIDQAAGYTRLRYITDVPGQQAVYMTKLQEAKAYLANNLSTPGPHIAKRAEKKGISVLAEATEVATTGETWNNVLSPAIEDARLSGKAAVKAGTTEAEVNLARDAAIAALNAL